MVTSVSTLFPALAKAQYMSLATFRKNGQAVSTPVWFAEYNGKLYVQTETTAGKIKRIRNNGKVTVAPCGVSGKPTGAGADGQAALVVDPSERSAAEAVLAKKYGLMRVAFGAIMNMMAAVRRHPHTEMAYIAIEPAR